MKVFFLSLLVLLTAAGCMSYGRIEDFSDPRVTSGSPVVISCGDRESYLLERINVSGGTVLGVGMKHDLRRGRWEHFNGVVPVESMTHASVRQLDLRRTLACGAAILFHVFVALILSSGRLATVRSGLLGKERDKSGTFAQYRRSLKFTGGEELFDLLIHRPMAFLIVRLIRPLPVSANHVTVISVFVFLGAAYLISTRIISSVAAAGVLILLGNVLDCADGQLARLRGTSSQYGRIVDGVADYISLIAVFAAFAVWQPSWEIDRILWVVLAAAAMVSFGWQSALVDYYRNEFSFRLTGKANFVREEIRQTEEANDALREGGGFFQRLSLRGYLAYHAIQQNMQRGMVKLDRVPASDYVGQNSVLVRLWCLNGSATARFLMAVFCFVNRPDLLIGYILVIGTLWTVILLTIQKRNDAKLLRRFS